MAAPDSRAMAVCMAPRNTVSSISATAIPDDKPASSSAQIAGAERSEPDPPRRAGEPRTGTRRRCRRGDADRTPREDTPRNRRHGRPKPKSRLDAMCRCRHTHDELDRHTSMATRLATRWNYHDRNVRGQFEHGISDHRGEDRGGEQRTDKPAECAHRLDRLNGTQAGERLARRRDRRVDIGVECAADTKPASNADGAKYTPSSSMRWKKRLKRSMSQAITLAKLSTRRSAVKKRPNMPHTWLVENATPALAAAPASRRTS